jgi:3-oxoacyl-[acyl-carrier protein] reductase
MDLGIAGRRAVVTGASMGIGLEVARRLAAAGADVLLVARDEERVRAAAEAVGGRWIATDVTSWTPEEPADVLVNNAGTSYAKGFDELTEDDWRAQYELHVVAPMRLMRALGPGMAERGWGRIVNVASSAGKRPSLTNPAYSVTKAAQLSLSRVGAELWSSQGVLCNAVAPGATASPLWMARGGLADQTAKAKGVSREEALQAQRDRLPLGRFAEPGEIADVIAFLCSERASAVAGAAWSADGGTVPIIL